MRGKPERTKNNISELTPDLKRLSIQFSLDGFSFCISDSLDKVIELSCHNLTETKRSPKLILDKIQEIFKQEKSLHDDFESVSLIHRNNLNTLVPNAFFDEKHLKDYLKFSVSIMETDLVVFDTLDFIESKTSKSVF